MVQGGYAGSPDTSDIGLSAFSLFFMQSEAFLSYQRGLQEGRKTSNFLRCRRHNMRRKIIGALLALIATAALGQTISPYRLHTRPTGAPIIDPQGDFLTTVNLPKAGGNGVPLPTNSNIVIGDGLAMEAGATQQFGAIFGTATPKANITTTQQVYDTFFTTTMEGNLDQAIGSPMDTGQSNNSTFNAVLRTYPPSSPNNLHVVASDGLHLRAACSANHTNCGPGRIYAAGVILSQLPIRPGMTIKLRRKTPKGDHSWASTWLFSINQGIPPVGTTSLWSDAAKAVMHNCGQSSYTTFGKCQEIDIDDNYSRFSLGTATGKQINYGYPDIYGSIWERGKFPHLSYGANSNGYVTHLNAGPDYEELPIDQTADFHDLVFDWRPDDTMNLFVDGKLVISGYQDHTTGVNYMENGILKYVGMQLMIQNAAVPGFSRGASSVTENDGLGVDGWAPVIQQLSIWNGNVANPQNFLASTTNAYAGNTGQPFAPVGSAKYDISKARVDANAPHNLAVKILWINPSNPADTHPEASSLNMIGLSTSKTTPPSCEGGAAAPATCYGATAYYNNQAGDWISFRGGTNNVDALPSGTYYFWVKTADGTEHLASTRPYVK